jgi:hypothetical protein
MVEIEGKALHLTAHFARRVDRSLLLLLDAAKVGAQRIGS